MPLPALSMEPDYSPVTSKLHISNQELDLHDSLQGIANTIRAVASVTDVKDTTTKKVAGAHVSDVSHSHIHYTRTPS
jgi:hypothetical protein